MSDCLHLSCSYFLVVVAFSKICVCSFAQPNASVCVWVFSCRPECDFFYPLPEKKRKTYTPYPSCYYHKIIQKPHTHTHNTRSPNDFCALIVRHIHQIAMSPNRIYIIYNLY